MSDQMKPKGTTSLSEVFRSASDSNFAGDLPASTDSQSSGEQSFQQAALSPPIISRRRRLLNKLKGKSPLHSRLLSPSPVVADHVATSLSQSPHIPASANQVQAPGQPGASMIWDKALEIAQKKLSDYNLPPLDLTNLTSQSAEENIQAVINALNTFQEDNQKKQWSYTWHGKEVIIVKRVGEILRSMEKYSKIVDTAIQTNPQVSALVWAGILAIMRVTLNHVEAIEGFEVAIASLLEKVSMCEFYSGIYTGASLPSRSTANTLQLQSMLDSALPELYAAVIVFSVKARTYFEARGMTKIANTLKSFDIEFQPFIEEINAREEAIREFADASTMERIRSIEGVLLNITSELKPLAKLNDISTKATQILRVTEQIQDNTKDDKILELLAMLTPLEPLKRHQDVKLPRTKNTGTWLLRLESFKEWQESVEEDQGCVFCCYGIPGAGKTVICSVVIDSLYSRFHKHPNVGIACLYADYKDQANQTLVHILGSFLRQFLTTATAPIPDEIIQKLQYIQLLGGKLGSEDGLALLKIRLNQLKHAFICIDAVDELEPKVQRQLLSVLKDLGSNTRLFLTGRDHVEREVQNRLQVVQRYQAVISASQQDIEAFVREQVTADDPYPGAMDQVLVRDIVDAIVTKSQGMFLLPTLHVKLILEMPTNSQRREALEILPTDLYDSFRGIISRIRKCPTSQAELGIRVLMWLHFAHRPLKLIELQHALAVRRSHKEFDAGNIPPLKALLDCCLGLVIVDEETSTVRFVHYTLEEYFRKYASAEFPNGCSLIAETCLTYLSFDKLRQHCTDLDSLKENMKNYAFFEYAVHHWGTYVKQPCSDDLTKLARLILDHESERPPCAIQALYWTLNKWYFESTIPRRFSGIHATAYFGLSEIMKYFSEVGLKDESGRTPLSWAAGNGHEAVVRLLIERGGIDLNARDDEATTPLTWAALSGHEAVVRLLIERSDVELNAKDDREQTPLIWAARHGREAVVRLLIEKDGVDINASDVEWRTPFLCAAMEGHEAVVRLLAERDGVDLHARDGGEMTPLILATLYGHVAVVRLLIEIDGVDLNAKDDGGRTPLIWAACQGHEAVVRLLLERDGVDLNSKDHGGRTPLIWAVCQGHEAVVRLLIERDGVDLHAMDNFGETALSLATLKGQRAVVQLLNDRRHLLARDSDIASAGPLAEDGAGTVT